MIEYYEVKSNVNLPSLGCTLTRGSRVKIENGTLTALGRSVPVGPDFQILLRHGILVRLTAAQAALPEAPEKPRTRPLHERSEMPIRAEESITVEMQRRIAARNSAAQDRRIVDYDNGTDRSEDNERTIRGMRVEQRTELPVHREQTEEQAPAVRLAPKHASDFGAKAARLAAVAEAKAKTAARNAEAAKAAKEKTPAAAEEAEVPKAETLAPRRVSMLKKPAEAPAEAAPAQHTGEQTAKRENVATPPKAPENAPKTATAPAAKAKPAKAASPETKAASAKGAERKTTKATAKAKKEK